VSFAADTPAVPVFPATPAGWQAAAVRDNRPRGNGEFYKPDIAVTSVGWRTADFQAAIEQDLGH
jgi:hypothetical protein